MNLAQFFTVYGSKLFTAILVHIQYVVVSVGVGFVFAVTLAIALSRAPRLSKIVIPVVGVFQTVPGLVFIGVLFIYTGMRPITVVIALSIYAMFPILKNTYIGIITVNEAMKEAARGCGMTDWQILFKVELPLAMSAIFSGVRMATIFTVSWAVLAAMIGQGGLGEFIYRGVETNNRVLIIGGALPAAALAVVLGLLIDYIQNKVTPRGLKGGRS